MPLISVINLIDPGFFSYKMQYMWNAKPFLVISGQKTDQIILYKHIIYWVIWQLVDMKNTYFVQAKNLK